MKNWSASRQAVFFVLVTFAITGIFHFRIIFHGGLEQNKWLIVPLMWVPGLVAIMSSLLFGHPVKNLGFKRASKKQLALAYLLPVAAAVFIFIMLLISGIDTFGIRGKFIEKYGSVKDTVLMSLAVAPTLGVLMGFPGALGEEIGWRGFLHNRMMELKVRHPFLIIGVIWACWHLPLIIFSDYTTSAHPFFSATIFSLEVLGVSVFMGWQRQLTGSVWPAAITHATHNVWIQGIYPVFIKKGPLDPYFGGESGIFLLIFYGAIALFLYRKYKFN